MVSASLLFSSFIFHAATVTSIHRTFIRELMNNRLNTVQCTSVSLSFSLTWSSRRVRGERRVASYSRDLVIFFSFQTQSQLPSSSCILQSGQDAKFVIWNAKVSIDICISNDRNLTKQGACHFNCILELDISDHTISNATNLPSSRL